MLDRWQRKLVISNVSVLLVVLTVFCAAVYSFGSSSFDLQLKDKMRSIADSAISSIDFEDFDGTDSGKPDLIVSVLPDEASPSLKNLRLQWFRPDGTLDIEKGSLAASLPLSKREGFQHQDSPEAWVFTKPAIAEGRLLGYVRVVHPLNEIRKEKQMLFECLAFGTLFAIIASGVGVFLLVRQSLKPVKASIRRLKQFCADAAHELRTPITAIRTNSSVALRHPNGMRESDKEKFQAIVSGARQMEQLIEDLLKLGEAEQQGDVSVLETPSLVPLKDAIDEVFEMLKTDAQTKRLNLENEVGNAALVSMGKEDLDCVLRNLISNSIKYTPDGGRVWTSCHRQNGNVSFTVSDNGIGISEPDLENVFERFWRADKVRNHASGGNGLGLSITRAIVERYGGTIAASSEPGKGSTFSVTLKSVP